MRKNAPTLRALRRAGLVVGLVGTALAGSAIAASPAAAGVEPDFVFGDSFFYEGTTNFGDLPDCGADNIDGHDDGATATWEILSTLAAGDEVEPGDTWVVRGRVTGFESGNGDNGPDPLGIRFLYTGPAEVVSLEPGFEIGPGEVVHGGGGSVGPVGPNNDTEYVFDVNSNPGVIESSDGVDVLIDVTFRATAEGVVNLSQFRVFGYDGTPQKGDFSCGVDLDWDFIVDDVDPPTSGADNARTDASYAFALIGDQNEGPHTISIPVLANDNDPEVAGPPGNPAEVRVHDWQPGSVQGGTVSCGTGAQKGNNTFASMSVGPCIYTPPLNLPQGTNDSFTYIIRSVSGKEKAVVVNIDLVDNVKPFNGNQVVQLPAGGGGFTLTPSDVTNDPIVCDAGLPTVTPATHVATVNADCSVVFDAGPSGQFTFPYRACDRHTTILPPNHGAIGSTSVVETGVYSDDDFSDTQSARCSDFTATVQVAGVGLPLPPNGVADFDIVDAGYDADGIGAYTIEIPVLDNDTDGNGVQPSDAAFNGTVAIVGAGPDPAEGTATVNADREIVFTPADGFEGPVEFAYNVGEDPAQQNPVYQGLPFAGIGNVSIFVVGNPAPVAEPDEVLTNSLDEVLDLDVGTNDTDPEGETLACTPGALVGQPAGIVQSASIGADCLVDITPVEGVDGIATLTYEVCDDHVLATPDFPATPDYGDDGRDPGDDANRCDEGEISVTVASEAEVLGDDLDNPDPDPTCVADAASTTAGTAVTVSVLTNDNDTELGGSPSPLTVDTAGTTDVEEATTQGGTAVVDANGTAVRYTPRAGFTGVDTFEYAALDTAGQFCTATVTVTVSAVVGTTGTTTPGTLPRTGSDGGLGQLLVGFGLAIAGFGVVLLARRRTEGGLTA